MRAAISPRMSTDKQSSDSPADRADEITVPEHPRMRAAADAIARALAAAVLREIRDEQARRGSDDEEAEGGEVPEPDPAQISGVLRGRAR